MQDRKQIKKPTTVSEINELMEYVKDDGKNDARAIKILAETFKDDHITKLKKVDSTKAAIFYFIKVGELGDISGYEQAADLGSTNALYKLGMIYNDGSEVYGIKKDESKKFEYGLRIAKSGDEGMQYRIGLAYQCAVTGAPHDLGQAFYWVNESAKNRHLEAIYTLALFYKSGVGVEPNEGKYHTWLKKAADRDHPEAQFQLGLKYLGDKTTLAEGLSYIQKSTKNGDKHAKVHMESLCEMFKISPEQEETLPILIVNFTELYEQIVGGEYPFKHFTEEKEVAGIKKPIFDKDWWRVQPGALAYQMPPLSGSSEASAASSSTDSEKGKPEAKINPAGVAGTAFHHQPKVDDSKLTSKQRHNKKRREKIKMRQQKAKASQAGEGGSPMDDLQPGAGPSPQDGSGPKI